MTADAELMEQSLLALADAEGDIRTRLFERFFAAFPDRRASFWALESTSIRMTDETLQMLLGLARGEGWVWPLLCDLVYAHRSYGALPAAEYDSFIDLAADEAALASRSGPAAQQAWLRQADALKALVRKAIADWQAAVPLSG